MLIVAMPETKGEILIEHRLNHRLHAMTRATTAAHPRSLISAEWFSTINSGDEFSVSLAFGLAGLAIETPLAWRL